MKPAPFPRRRARAGMLGLGLFDALIALAILAFGMLAMTRFQGRMVAQTTESQSRQVATQFAAEHLSTVLVDVNNAACYTRPQSGGCSNSSAIANTTSWATRVANALPGTVSTSAALSTVAGCSTPCRMTLTINWTGKDSGEPRKLVTVTDVRP